jgi:hypothetical protein
MKLENPNVTQYGTEKVVIIFCRFMLCTRFEQCLRKRPLCWFKLKHNDLSLKLGKQFDLFNVSRKFII